jgi:hypothetical protein
MNKKMLFLAVCVFASTFLSGCAEQWQKQGAAKADFQAIKSACESRALSRFPVAIRQMQTEEGRMDPVATRCTGAGLATRCSTSGGRYVPPKFVPVDDNTDARDQDVRRCYFENGWQPVKRESVF